MESKILQGVKPFNDFLYRSCYYHQLIAAYSYFNISPHSIMLNYHNVMKFDGEALKFDYEQIKNKKEFELYTGVQECKVSYKKIKDLEKYIIAHIDKNEPIMILVDCFELPYRDDAYKKIHNYHYVLIYGYDLTKSEFVCSEHFCLNSFIYKEYTIKMEELINATRSQMIAIAKQPNVVFLKYRAPQQLEEPKIILKNLISLKPLDILNIKKALNTIKQFVDMCEKVDDNDLKRFEWLRNMQIQLNVQKHLINYAWGKNEYYFLLDRIKENYMFLIGVLVKIKLTGKMIKEFKERTLNRIDEIIKLEEKLIIN